MDDLIGAAITDTVNNSTADAIVTGYVWMTAYKRPDDYDTTTYYALGYAPHMPPHESEGMAARLTRTLIEDAAQGDDQ